jgi:hypothetical protein
MAHKAICHGHSYSAHHHHQTARTLYWLPNSTIIMSVLMRAQGVKSKKHPCFNITFTPCDRPESHMCDASAFGWGCCTRPTLFQPTECSTSLAAVADTLGGAPRGPGGATRGRHTHRLGECALTLLAGALAHAGTANGRVGAGKRGPRGSGIDGSGAQTHSVCKHKHKQCQTLVAKVGSPYGA